MNDHKWPETHGDVQKRTAIVLADCLMRNNVKWRDINQLSEYLTNTLIREELLREPKADS